jgi:hypothetical protein
METNLDGVFLCAQAATPALKDTRGAIVNIASISGLRASTLRVAYGTSKAAVMHLTKQQAAELGEYGIRVNCVCPGPVRTKLAMAVHSQAIIDAYHDAIPLESLWLGGRDRVGHNLPLLARSVLCHGAGDRRRRRVRGDGDRVAGVAAAVRPDGRIRDMERIGVIGLGRMGSAMARKDNDVFRRVAESYGLHTPALELAGQGQARQIAEGRGDADPAVAIASVYRIE